MKKRILFFVILFCPVFFVNAQFEIRELDGSFAGSGTIEACQAIILKNGFKFTAASNKNLILRIQPKLCLVQDIGVKSSTFSYEETFNTEDCGNAFGGSANDYVHKLVLTSSMEIKISHCKAILTHTQLFLLDSNNELIASSTGNSGTCSTATRAYLFQKQLPAGTYYIVSEGQGTMNGEITLSVEGTVKISEQQSVPSANQNYILTKRPKVLGNTTDGLTITQANQSVQYLDGLGRLVQTVEVAASPEGKDLVNYMEYDHTNNEDREWLYLPIENNKGAFVNFEAFKAINSLPEYGEGSPKKTTVYEASGLKRVEEQKNPGTAWHEHPVEINYYTNAVNEVSLYKVEGGKLRRSGYYAKNTLYKTEIIDEDRNKSYEYKNMTGQVVMTRQICNSINHDTYYVYDDMSQLCYVLPPLASDSLSGTIFDDTNNILKRYAYIYKYDYRGRNVEKKLPGCEPVYMIYDQADQLILTQDGNLRKKGEWLFTIPDRLGRIAITGILKREILDRTSFLKDKYVSTIRSERVSLGYLVPAALNITYEENFLSVIFYDDYDWLDTSSSLYYVQNASYGEWDQKGQGLMTGMRTYPLYGMPESEYITTAYYYDYKGRQVQVRSDNQLGGVDCTYYKYNLLDRVVAMLKEHNIVSPASPVISETYAYTYDHNGRLINTYLTMSKGGNGKVLLSQCQYDKLGRLSAKAQHNHLKTTQYEYNIRNWLTRISEGEFNQTLYYNKVPMGDITPLYNGNITAMSWRYPGVVNAYRYEYDGLNRLTLAQFGEVSETSWSFSNKYNESYEYDKMGNIIALSRYSDGNLVDDLELKYNGNQLYQVTDHSTWNSQSGSYDLKEYQDHSTSTNSTEFYYDANGNMITDLDRKISTITYNVLNLPDTIQFSTGEQIINRYDAAGFKCQADYISYGDNIQVPMGSILHSSGTIKYKQTFAYADNVDYKLYNNSSYSCQRIKNAEGFYDETDKYNYFRRDHLGNVREVWKNFSASGATYQRMQYYPSGLPWSVSESPAYQPYKYNGKEFVEDHGYDSYDYQARQMYPAIMRFTTVDPLAEKYYSVSPYSYCLNNPVYYVDPDGRFVGTAIGVIIGGATGAYQAYRNGTDIWAGAAEGAVAGAITGAAVDIAVAATFATGGGALVAIGAGAVAGAAGGAIGSVAGDVAGQVVEQRDAVTTTISTENFADKAITGAVVGAVNGVTGGAVGALGKVATTSTLAVQATMSQNITSTAAVLTSQGATQSTVNAAVSSITKGMGTAGSNTVNAMIKVEAAVSTGTAAGVVVVDEFIGQSSIVVK